MRYAGQSATGYTAHPVAHTGYGVSADALSTVTRISGIRRIPNQMKSNHYQQTDIHSLAASEPKLSFF